jgi:hypothetical protein
MSSWGNYDASSNAPYWVVNSTVAPDNPNRARPTAANVALLYGNTSSDVYTTDEKIGLFMVDSAEEQVQESTSVKPAHSGWNLRKEGSGGRAGRVTWETLVTIANVQSDNNSDDATLPDAVITITQPATLRTLTANAQGANTTTLSVVGTTVVPSSATLTYQWQVNAGGMNWVDMPTGVNVTTGQPGSMKKSNSDTATVTLAPTATTANNYVYRAKITATNAGIQNSGVTVYSANSQVRIY